MDKFRLVLLGDSGVGKSAIACRYLFRKFRREYSVTLEDTYNKKVTIDDESIEIDILDTAGQDGFRKAVDSRF